MEPARIDRTRSNSTSRTSAPTGPRPTTTGQAQNRVQQSSGSANGGGATAKDRGVDSHGLSDSEVKAAGSRFAWAAEEAGAGSKTVGYKGVSFDKAATVRDFGREKVQIGNTSGVDQKTGPDGKPLKFDWSLDVLREKNGTPLYTQGLGDLQQDFKNDGNADWQLKSQLKPAGAVGDYLSMVVNERSYTGGASPNSESRLVTIDKNTGNPVELKNLIKPEQFNQVVDKILDVQSYVPKAENYAAGEQQIRDYANNSFALFKEGDQTRLSVAIPNSRETHDGKVAEYTFDLPGFTGEP